MMKFVAIALVTLSTLSGLTAAARADYFGTSKEVQGGQHATGQYGEIEKGGI